MMYIEINGVEHKIKPPSINNISNIPDAPPYLSFDTDPVKPFRLDYPNGDYQLFNARLSEVSWEPLPDGGHSLTLPIRLHGNVLEGSIYDPEGAD
jgi:hypothetical protein